MMLLADYRYLDPINVTWLAPRLSKVNGASIPRALWSFVGGPFEGQYRKASVVHDVACDFKKVDWRVVHKMFHDATRCEGIGPIKAAIMYWAVYQCGPRWGNDQGIQICAPVATVKNNIRRMKVFARQHADLSPDELAHIAPDRLAEVDVDVQSFDSRVRKLREGVPATITETGVRVVLGEGWLYERDNGRIRRVHDERVDDIAKHFEGIPGFEIEIRPKVAENSGATDFTRAQEVATETALRLFRSNVHPSNISFAPVEARPSSEAPLKLISWQEMIIREGL